MSKVDLRNRAKSLRANAHSRERLTAGAALARYGLSFIAPRRSAVVAGFFSLDDEIDVLPLLARLHSVGQTLALPVMLARNQPLAFRSWAPGDPMAEAVWGIHEPLADKPVVEPDILLVPLLAVDGDGWRLGYGGGYYDRSLRRLRGLKPIIAVGIAYDAQCVDAVPHLDYDERLDWVLTPSGPRQF